MAVGKTGYIDVTIMPQSVGKVRVYWREDYYVDGNYSTITLTDAEGYLWHRYYDTIVNMKFAIDGTTFYGSTGSTWHFAAGADTTFRPVENSSGTAFGGITSPKLYHDDATGKRTITLTFTLVDVWNSDAGFDGTDNQSAEQSIALTAIPRASTVSATDANIESVSSVSVNRKSSAYTHSIAYKFGNLSGYINSDGDVSNSEVKLSSTSIGFTIPTTFYAQIPNAKTGKCTLTIKTYSGNTQIGDAKTCTFTVTAAQSKCMPAVSGTVVDVNETTLALTGDENKLVRFYSNALATITAEAKNSASIASKAIAGVEVSENTRTIEAVETASFVFGATDSRGYSNSASVTKTLIPYIKLTANMTVSRDDPTSGKATLIIKGDYFNDSFGAVDNALTVQFRIDEGEWVSITPTIDGNTYIAVAALTDLDYQSTFAFDVVAADKLMNVPKSDTLNKGIANVHIGEENVTFEVDVSVRKNLNVMQMNIGGKALWEYFMPVGYIYISSDAVSPAELYGGTWEQLTDRVIIGAGGSYAVDATGGSATHTLTANQLPKITGNIGAGQGSGSTSYGNFRDASGAFSTVTAAKFKPDMSEGTYWGGNSANKSYYGVSMSFGGGAAHNNMQPYVAKYIWERVE